MHKFFCTILAIFILSCTTALARAATEQQSWDKALQDNSVSSYDLYLKDYPNGQFADLARTRVDAIRKERLEAEESRVWNKASSMNSQPDIEAYLKRYPSGRYVAEANAKLKQIQEEEAKRPVIIPEMVAIPGKNYEIGKFEVTQTEWFSVMGYNPSKFGNCGDTCPVEKVSWDDVQVYIHKLNAKTGKQYRLPTEAEWEFACYGGIQSEFCGGKDVDAVAWLDSKGNDRTHPVGKKKANNFGLYDMSGNVMEWMNDCWEGDCTQRVFRGGSWINDERATRASSRIRFITSIRNSSGGFRLARTIP
jgi:formylglycine-generating enzyme required for sulfatase activity